MSFLASRFPTGDLASAFQVEERAQLLTVVNREWIDRISLQTLTDLVATSLAASVHEQATSGRQGVGRLQLSSGEKLIARSARRGGLFGKFVRETYLRHPFRPIEELRPLAELVALSNLRISGVRVPEPIAATVKFSAAGLAYRSVIFTREIEGVENLLLLAQAELKNSDRLRSIAHFVGVEAQKMLAAGIYHSDLHLGNVLVSGSIEAPLVTLIDFDKCVRFLPPFFKDYRVKLIERWERSAVKHGVSAFVTSPFKAALLAPEVLAGGSLKEKS